MLTMHVATGCHQEWFQDAEKRPRSAVTQDYAPKTEIHQKAMVIKKKKVSQFPT